MNEFGIDTAYANYLTQEAVDDLDFGIFRLTDLGYVGSGTSSYYNKSNAPDAACLPNMRIVQSNGKHAGIYFFSHAWDATSAAFEANYCCDQLDAWNFTPRLGVFMDFERLGSTGRIGGFENLIYINGGWPSASLMQTIYTSWCSTILSRGYRPGLYMNADPISAVTDTWLQNARFDANIGSPLFWLAQWASSNSWDCDIWQYSAGSGGMGDQWHGITVDYDRCLNDRIFSGAGLPIWLKLYLGTRGDTHGKRTLLL